MKRYVTEFANDIIKQDKECALMKPEIRESRRIVIENIVRCYRRYQITATEAVECILNVVNRRETE